MSYKVDIKRGNVIRLGVVHSSEIKSHNMGSKINRIKVRNGQFWYNSLGTSISDVAGKLENQREYWRF